MVSIKLPVALTITLIALNVVEAASTCDPSRANCGNYALIEESHQWEPYVDYTDHVILSSHNDNGSTDNLNEMIEQNLREADNQILEDETLSSVHDDAQMDTSQQDVANKQARTDEQPDSNGRGSNHEVAGSNEQVTTNDRDSNAGQDFRDERFHGFKIANSSEGAVIDGQINIDKQTMVNHEFSDKTQSDTNQLVRLEGKVDMNEKASTDGQLTTDKKTSDDKQATKNEQPTTNSQPTKSEQASTDSQPTTDKETSDDKQATKNEQPTTDGQLTKSEQASTDGQSTADKKTSDDRQATSDKQPITNDNTDRSDRLYRVAKPSDDNPPDNSVESQRLSNMSMPEELVISVEPVDDERKNADRPVVRQSNVVVNEFSSDQAPSEDITSIDSKVSLSEKATDSNDVNLTDESIFDPTAARKLTSDNSFPESDSFSSGSPALSEFGQVPEEPNKEEDQSLSLSIDFILQNWMLIIRTIFCIILVTAFGLLRELWFRSTLSSESSITMTHDNNVGTPEDVQIIAGRLSDIKKTEKQLIEEKNDLINEKKLAIKLEIELEPLEQELSSMEGIDYDRDIAEQRKRPAKFREQEENNNLSKKIKLIRCDQLRMVCSLISNEALPAIMKYSKWTTSFNSLSDEIFQEEVEIESLEDQMIMFRRLLNKFHSDYQNLVTRIKEYYEYYEELKS